MKELEPQIQRPVSGRVPVIKTGVVHSVPELKRLAGLPAGEAFASNVAPCLIKKLACLN